MKAHEHERYTLDRCAVQAKFLFAAKPPPVVPAPLSLLSPTRATSAGMVEAGTSPPVAAAERKHDKAEKTAQDLASRRAGNREVEHSRREVEGGRGGGNAEEEGGERGHGCDTRGAGRNRSPCSGRGVPRAASDRGGDDRMAADDAATQETAVNTRVRGGESGRRKGKEKEKEKKREVRNGKGAGSFDEGVAQDGGFEEVAMVLSRKQERTRNGRRPKNSM